VSGSTLRDFPEEVAHGPWPSLEPTLKDYEFVPQLRPVNGKESPSLRPGESESLQQLLLLHVLTMSEGAILGAFLFVLVSLPLYDIWFPNWHWLYLCGMIIIARLFFSTRLTLVISLALTIFLAWVVIILQTFTITFWVEGWHFFYPTITLFGVGLLFVFFRVRWAIGISLAIATLAACWFSWSFLLTHLIVLLVFSIVGALTGTLL
jgi:hypothetical protein